MADEARVEARREMRALDERVEREHERAACRSCDERAVVADPDKDVLAPCATAREKALDQLEFARRHRHATSPRSAPRCAREARSSTAFT